MSILFECIELVATFIEVFILYRIYGILFRKYRNSNKKKTDFCLALIAVCIIRIFNQFSIFSYFALLFFTVYMSVTAKYCYKVNYISLLSISSFYLLCLNCFDFLILTLILACRRENILLMEVVAMGSMMRVCVIIIVKSLWIILYAIIKKYLYIFSEKLGYGYAILIVSGVGFVGFVSLANQTIKAFDNRITGIWWVLTVVISFSVFFFYYVAENRKRRMRLNIVEMHNELLEEKYKTINNIYMSNAKLYHDLNNHLNVLYQMLDNNNITDAKRYIEEISKPMLNLSKTIWTGVDVVDVVINSKLEKMKEAKIQADINVEFPAYTNILPHDICTILANLLDNAIEATSCTENPRNISLTIRKINHFVLIKVKNTCLESDTEFIEYPVTTKKHKKYHGWGIPSVKDVVEKYNGVFNCRREKNIFITEIMLFYEIHSS